MSDLKPNKRKIVNDPVYGFINIPPGIVFDIIEHKYFQRLRRIKQLGLTYYVYPGAIHNRFQHVLGAMHLTKSAIDILRYKGNIITEEEEEAVIIAVLLHDIGHGPFSHALEHSIVENISHEEISLIFMKNLNQEFNGKLSLAIKIFKNKYSKHFLHQLVSGQLDVDRLDYLKRDSFFTGVSEGVISSDRIIKMLNIHNDNLVVESKGIYSIEKFLIARRLMFWQVYLHKTVLSAEQLLVKILNRAKELTINGELLFATPALQYFLTSQKGIEDFKNDCAVIENFAKLDDYDIISSIKVWTEHSDIVLSTLCKGIVNRKLLKIKFQKQPFCESELYQLKIDLTEKLNISIKEAEYFVFTGEITNNTYSPKDDKINILSNNGEIIDIAEASDMLNISVLSKIVKKYYLCYLS
ncbi:MAG: phosphohydrolase [Bacteroidetes bacterium GWA2_31_9]|nr:MAG: phosphohydrolase [Bacteroidetes bacterium GWA2_31_9]